MAVFRLFNNNHRKIVSEKFYLYLKLTYLQVMRIFITFFSQSYLLLDQLKRVKTPHYSKVYGVLFSKGHLSIMLVTDVLTKLGKNSIFDV